MYRRSARSLVSLVAFIAVAWFILSRLRFVVFVSIPWWGLLLLALVAFLVLDWLLAKLVR